MQKAGQKLCAFSRIEPYRDIPKRGLLLNALFMSQLIYFPLLWMCHRRSINPKINRLHERCLRIIYCDKSSTFQELLDEDGSVTIHKQNLQFQLPNLQKSRLQC